MNIDTTPFWEEAARRVADGSNWLVGSRAISKIIGVDQVTEEDLRAGYDPDLWDEKFHFDQRMGKGYDAFFMEFTPHRR